ncbi:hypothetical protein ACA910_015158 [Epithemia clementina (nom. ined.)]
MIIALASLAFLFPSVALLATATTAEDNLRYSAGRIRHFNNGDPSTFQSSSAIGYIPGAQQLFDVLDNADPSNAEDAEIVEQLIDEELKSEEESFESILQALDDTGMSFAPAESAEPSLSPSDLGSSSNPSVQPSMETSATPAVALSSSPSQASGAPSANPTVSAAPSMANSAVPSLSVFPTRSPSSNPTPVAPFTPPPTNFPTQFPSLTPSKAPSSAPSKFPTFSPTRFPTFPQLPSAVPTTSTQPSSSPSDTPSSLPTTEFCKIPGDVRIAQIYNILDAVADPVQIRNESDPRGLATEWLLSEISLFACPDNPKLVQRWALAVMYFSTGGNSWTQCSANASATDNCGNQVPFVNSTRFLSSGSECDWAGISCIDDCVTEVEYEENNLVGTIPSEMGLLTDLAIWGMERGGLTSTIPTEIGRLTNLIFLDLDFNELSGSLTSELLSLSSLTQLDLNDNQFTGSINGIGVFPAMEFLQIHANLFTGTVPEAVGNYTNMTVFTLHRTNVTGVMPDSVCDLLLSAGNGGTLTSLIADCEIPDPDIICDCCTDCRDT